MKLHRILCLALSCLAFAFTGTFAQAEKAASPAPPTDQHQRLAMLAGDWEVAVKFKVGPGQFQEGKATCTAQWILGGKFLQQEYKSILNGQPFTVLQLLGYDTEKKQFVEVYLNSMETAIMYNLGALSAEGKVLTHHGEHRDPATRQLAKLRTVYTFTDQDHFVLEWFQTEGNGQEEKVVMLTHTRRKS